MSLTDLGGTLAVYGGHAAAAGGRGGGGGAARPQAGLHLLGLGHLQDSGAGAAVSGPALRWARPRVASEPPARSGHSACSLAPGQLLIAGGWGGGRRFHGDAWLWEGGAARKGGVWREVRFAAPHQCPPERAFGAACPAQPLRGGAGGAMLISGGQREDGTETAELGLLRIMG
eukprot:TRINITY_DN23117_c0_g1_i1.p5 TRINITY_DN23117_c0_g1~~TRINITY_DN23117_c0_g1_i1.p5  ORF type:complete len:173 (+),score=33.32 TRINITY_DN23117_c0_g1_i1:1023-1541(+)